MQPLTMSPERYLTTFGGRSDPPWDSKAGFRTAKNLLWNLILTVPLDPQSTLAFEF